MSIRLLKENKTLLMNSNKLTGACLRLLELQRVSDARTHLFITYKKFFLQLLRRINFVRICPAALLRNRSIYYALVPYLLHEREAFEMYIAHACALF